MLAIVRFCVARFSRGLVPALDVLAPGRGPFIYGEMIPEPYGSLLLLALILAALAILVWAYLLS